MADARGMINQTISIKDTIKPRLNVYDSETEKVGTVWQIHRVPGYFTVQVRPLPRQKDNPFVEKQLYVPFRLISSIDARELFLSVTNDELRRDFSTVPPRMTRVEKEEWGDEVAVTTQTSGYDGTPIVVRQVPIEAVKRAVRVGDRVYSSDPTDLGTVRQYDRATGWMQIARDTPSRQAILRLPVAIVDAVNEEAHEVYLVLSEADLERTKHLVAVDAAKNEAKDRT